MLGSELDFVISDPSGNITLYRAGIEENYHSQQTSAGNEIAAARDCARKL